MHQEAQSEMESAPAPEPKEARGGRASMLVAAGILLSRLAGLVRESVTAMYLGNSAYADAFRAGVRMPNFLQNLLGEGTLSASFIPIYSELLHEGRKEEAGRFAGAIFALLFALGGALSLAGIALAPVLTDVFTVGFTGERRELTIAITRIIFPMTGILVLSAWSLGILNSHRKFFIPYVAPVLWNAAIISALVYFGPRLGKYDLVVAVSWGALVGGTLQFAVQLPWVFRLERSLKIRWDTKAEHVRLAVRNALPAVMGRGVVQLSGYADMVLASLLAVGSVSRLTVAMTLYMLPISLFGMAVAAAELPELARQRTGAGEALRARAQAGVERIAFYVVPSFVAFLAIGDVIVAGLLERGAFDPGETTITWLTLIGFSAGLLATTSSRLLSSTFFALRDTKTPARAATIRVLLSVVLGVALMLAFEPITLDKGGIRLAIPGGPFSDVRAGGKPLGVFGLALGAGIAAWVEWWLLRRGLARTAVGPVNARLSPSLRTFGAAAVAAAAGLGLKMVTPEMPNILRAVAVCGGFGVAYIGTAAALGLEEARVFTGRLTRLVRRR